MREPVVRENVQAEKSHMVYRILIDFSALLSFSKADINELMKIYMTYSFLIGLHIVVIDE